LNGRPAGASALLEIHATSIGVTIGDQVGEPIHVPLKAGWRFGRAGFSQRLRRFKDKIPAGALSVEDAYRALETLYDKMYAVTEDIFGNKFDELVDLFEEHKLDRARTNLLVEVIGADTEFLPLELLPLFPHHWRERSADVVTPDDLRQVAQTFLGFKAVVRRTMWASVTETAVIRSGPELPVRLFRDAGMRGAALEQRSLKARERIMLRASWPPPGLDRDRAARSLSEFIHDSAHAGGHAPDAPDAVQHFACHFVENDKDPAESHLQVQAPGEASHNIEMDSLSREMHRRRRNGAAPSPLPLVFANACGSSALSPVHASSLPTIFIRNGNPGFIGAETRIPDDFAAAFSEGFYDRWLNGQPLGTALLDTKLQMLEEQCNPLGILYSMYGDPDLRLEYLMEGTTS
jgi:hypothetical protein